MDLWEACRARLVEVLRRAPRHASPLEKTGANRLNSILTTAPSRSKAGSHPLGTTIASARLQAEAKLQDYHASLAKDFCDA